MLLLEMGDAWKCWSSFHLESAKSGTVACIHAGILMPKYCLYSARTSALFYFTGVIPSPPV